MVVLALRDGVCYWKERIGTGNKAYISYSEGAKCASGNELESGSEMLR